MALPGAWTESLLVTEMQAETEGVLAALGLGSTGLIATAVEHDTPAVLGVSSVADVAYGSVADVVKVRVIAQWCTWQRAYDKAIPLTDVKGGSVDVKRSQTFEHLKARLAAAERAAMRYAEVQAALAGGAVACVSGTSTASSPYSPLPSPGW
jgi:hypothetical protein